MKENSIRDHILSIVWVYFLLFPTGTTFNISIPVILLLLFDAKSSANRITIPMLVLVIFTLMVNILQPYMDFKPIVRLITIVVILLTFASVRGNRILFSYILFATVFIFLSQISYLYNISFLTSFYDNFYSVSTKGIEAWGISERSLSIEGISSGNTRLGGIYYNPNNCASYISVLFAIGICELQRINAKKIWFYAFAILVLLSFIVTGSRTSIIIFVAIVLYYFHTQGRSIKKYLPLAIVVVAFIFIIQDFGELRFLQVGEGMDNSFGVKMKYFTKYLSEADNPIHLLFGAGDQLVTVVRYNSPLPGTDFDLGDIFIVFGFFFYIVYISFYFKLYKKLTPIHRVILIVLLWSFSNSLLCSYRMCPVWFMALGVCYKQSLQIRALEWQQRISQKQIQQVQ